MPSAQDDEECTHDPATGSTDEEQNGEPGQGRQRQGEGRGSGFPTGQDGTVATRDAGTDARPTSATSSAGSAPAPTTPEQGPPGGSGARHGARHAGSTGRKRPGHGDGAQDRGRLVARLVSSAAGSESATMPPPAWT